MSINFPKRLSSTEKTIEKNLFRKRSRDSVVIRVDSTVFGVYIDRRLTSKYFPCTYDGRRTTEHECYSAVTINDPLG